MRIRTEGISFFLGFLLSVFLLSLLWTFRRKKKKLPNSQVSLYVFSSFHDNDAPFLAFSKYYYVPSIHCFFYLCAPPTERKLWKSVREVPVGSELHSVFVTSNFSLRS